MGNSYADIYDHHISYNSFPWTFDKVDKIFNNLGLYSTYLHIYVFLT